MIHGIADEIPLLSLKTVLQQCLQHGSGPLPTLQDALNHNEYKVVYAFLNRCLSRPAKKIQHIFSFI